jgi:hypothetical protein
LIEYRKVRLAGFPLRASKFIDGKRQFKSASDESQSVGSHHELGLGAFRKGVTVVAQRSFDDRALVEDLPRQNRLYDPRSPHRIIRPAVLCAPQQHIPRYRAFDAGQEAAVLREVGDSNAGVGRRTHQWGTDGDLAKAHDRTDGMYRNTAKLGTFG